MLLAAIFEFVLRNEHAQLALFSSWALMAIAALLLLTHVTNLLRNAGGKLDAAELVTLAWFVLLSSALGAASLWNVYHGTFSQKELTAFVDIPTRLWVMAGLPLLANVGTEAVYRLRGLHAVHAAAVTPPMQQLLSSPLDSTDRAQMGNAQYLMLNLIVLIVYAIAIARLFGEIVPGKTILAFPDLPETILALIGVSVGGYVATTATDR
jgi:hypothetical protein